MTVDVVVTGLGAVTPLGGDVHATWQRLIQGESAAVRLTDDWAADLPAAIAAPVPDSAFDRLDDLDPTARRSQDRGTHLAVLAADEAWRDAGDPDIEPNRLAVCIGTGIGGIQTVLAQEAALRDRGPRRVSPWTVPSIMPNGPAAAVGLARSARAGVHAPVSACASGAEAIAWGLDLIRLDRADVVIAGGTEAAITRLPMAAFAAMRALSTRVDQPAVASRPFDKQRDGFVLGEGAGIVVLERAEHAAARGARVRGRVLGAGMSNDSHHVAAPEPTGQGAAEAIRRALRDAGVAGSDLAHINAHATSTPVGDVAEAAAIRAALGSAADGIPVTATKSCSGHLLGAAGAVEAIVTLLSLQRRIVPAIRNLDDPDDDVELDLVRVDPRSSDGTIAISNSFGFGGHNVTLVLGAAA